MLSLPHLCRVVTVEGCELPKGHSFVIVRHPEDGVVIYVKPDDRSQLDARAAFLAWDRLRDTAPPAPAAVTG